ncbi:hypothetical protein NESM_000810000 [Novymonas esmeraldas]|uniref:Uncharacterized protein n=1 Tax=Novymonas esmeraldas TaxID=1808958 RepID=A0AAW0EXF7_9TRYP
MSSTAPEVGGAEKREVVEETPAATTATPTAATAAVAGTHSRMWSLKRYLTHWRSNGDDNDAAAAEVAEEDKRVKGEGETLPTADGDVPVPAPEAAAAAAAAAGPAPPTNIWLRRALERQSEFLAAQTRRDSKLSPDAAADGTTGAARPTTRFAELMRQCRESSAPPSTPPVVKGTNVVKKPKAASLSAAAEEAPPPPLEAGKAAATAPVHQTAVRKRAKGTSNSASAKRTREASAAVSAAATPTHVTTVKGRVSLDELRARRNRTSVLGGSASPHHTSPTPADGGARVGAADSSVANHHSGTAAGDAAQTDQDNDCATDAVSRLLLRYCLGDRAEPVAAEGTADAGATAAAATTSDVEFFNELMQMCESNSLTLSSVELLRELFQHVRVLPRPAVAAGMRKNAGADTSTGAAEADEEETEDREAAAAAMEAYREATRRHEYVQQVVMVLLNRLGQIKAREQQQQQQQGCGPTATTAVAPPQLVIGHGTPSITSGGAPPTPMAPASAWAEWMGGGGGGGGGVDEAAAQAALATAVMTAGYPDPYAHLTVFAQHQPVAPPLGWPSSSSPASWTPSYDGDGRHSHDPHRLGGGGGGAAVAARLVASPFPGAFPLLPPPPHSAAAEDHEMEDLFRIIRVQLTRPPSTTASTSRQERPAGPVGSATVEVSEAERAALRHIQMDFRQQQQQQHRATAPASPPPPQTASTPPTTSLPVSPEVTAVAAEQRRMHATPGPTVDSPPLQSGGGGGGEKTRQQHHNHHRTLFTQQETWLEGPEKTCADSPSTRSVTAPPLEERDNSAAAAAKRHGAALSLHARPFVPHSVAAAESTPTKTTFNRLAAPFVPSTAAAPAPPPAHKPMSAAAHAFVPQQSHVSADAAATGVAANSQLVAANVEGSGSAAASMPLEERDNSAAAAAKRHGAALSLHARPFVPHSVAAAESTPTKTTFNRLAAPFVPSTAAAPAPPPAHKPMNAAAHAFVPQQSHVSADDAAAIGGARSSSAPLLPAAAVQPPALPSPAGGGADPWASYAMFARWRDIMENYYQNVFASMDTAAAASASAAAAAALAAPPSSPGCVPSALQTPPRHS